MLVKRFGLVIKKPARVAFGVIFRVWSFLRSRVESNLVIGDRGSVKSFISPRVVSKYKIL
jgi:hypothetical protein